MDMIRFVNPLGVNGLVVTSQIAPFSHVLLCPVGGVVVRSIYFLAVLHQMPRLAEFSLHSKNSKFRGSNGINRDAMSAQFHAAVTNPIWKCICREIYSFCCLSVEM